MMKKSFLASMFLLVGIMGLSTDHALVSVTTHNENANLTEGFNLLVGGTAFVLPANLGGARYLVVNESGQPVNIVPGSANSSIGSLPPGHQGVLGVNARLDIIDIGQNRYFLWQGTVADGGDYYGVPIPGPDISLSTSDLSFGNVTENTSESLNLTVTNSGSADLLLGTIGTADPLTAPFSLLGNCSNQTLEPTSTCTLSVQFLPTAIGAFSDSFDIPSNDPDQPAVVLVSGNGVVAGSGGNGISTDFTEVGFGSGVPANWTERWEVGNATYAVLESLDFPGQNELMVSESTGARRLITFDSADSLGPDVDLLMLFKDPVNEGSTHTDFRLLARASGQAGSETAYYFTTNNHQQQVNIYKYVNGALTSLVGEKEKIPFNSNDPWWVRFRTEGNLLYAKIWPYGSVEPGEWQLSAVDTDITAAGWQGIGTYWIGDHFFYEFSAAALQDIATPVNGFGIIPLIPNAINLDAETGTTAGWENEFGTMVASSGTQRNGGFCFQGGQQDFRAYQRIDLAQNGITQAHLDNGAKFSFRAWQRSLTWNDDPGRIGLRFLDVDQIEITSFFTDWDYKNGSYVPKGLIETIPTNAAFVDIILEGQLVKGIASSSYFDDLEVGIGIR